MVIRFHSDCTRMTSSNPLRCLSSGVDSVCTDLNPCSLLGAKTGESVARIRLHCFFTQYPTSSDHLGTAESPQRRETIPSPRFAQEPSQPLWNLQHFAWRNFGFFCCKQLRICKSPSPHLNMTEIPVFQLCFPSRLLCHSSSCKTRVGEQSGLTD